MLEICTSQKTLICQKAIPNISGNNKVNNNKKVKIFSIIDSENKRMTDDADIANEFNTFLTYVCENIA